MLFELANVPVTFQIYINKTLSDLLDVCCIVYLNDILIYSTSRGEHHCHVQTVLKCLQKYRLYVKLSKCTFEVDTVNFLSFVISLHEIQMKNSCIKVILKWLEPTCIKNIQIFLGFTNFYQHFIEAY